MKNLCCTGLAIVAGLFGFTPADASPPRAATARAERFAAAWPGTIDASAIDAATLGAGGRPDRTEPRADRVPRGADSRVVISEGFAGIERANGLFAQGWRRQNNSDHPWLVWQQGIPSSFLAADGSPSAYVASHPFATLANAGTISSWIVTPPINFASRTRV
jgi:hypothetical protein